MSDVSGVISYMERRDAVAANPISEAEAEIPFSDVLDAVNPLHHLPVVGPVYRQQTGDEISDPAKIAGGALYGGIAGLSLSTADVVLQQLTGQDFATHLKGVLQDPEAVASSTSKRVIDPVSEQASTNGLPEVNQRSVYRSQPKVSASYHIYSSIPSEEL
ncbi:hypothetical protein ACQZV8_14160 [Magnetococcales bacterium HHB-1]